MGEWGVGSGESDSSLEGKAPASEGGLYKRKKIAGLKPGLYRMKEDSSPNMRGGRVDRKGAAGLR